MNSHTSYSIKENGSENEYLFWMVNNREDVEHIQNNIYNVFGINPEKVYVQFEGNCEKSELYYRFISLKSEKDLEMEELKLIDPTISKDHGLDPSSKDWYFIKKKILHDSNLGINK